MSASKAAMAKELRELREELAVHRRVIAALVETTRPDGHDGPWWPLSREEAPSWFWADYA